MANGTPAFPSQAAMQQQQQMRSMNSTMSSSSDSVARVKQQQQAMANGAHTAATQLQQRAAQAAQFLTAERKISSREIQAMLEKNDAALRGWNVLHTQEPPKTLEKEHKDWIRKCMTYRQQVGARLEVLASLADKQIAIEDESSDRVKKAKTQPQQERAPAAAPPPSVVHPPQTASKKSKASVALARQAAQNKQKAVPVATQRAAPAAIDNSAMQLPTSAVVSAAPIPPPTSFPEPPMPMVNPQQFGYPATTNGVFYGSNQSSAMTSASGFGNTSMVTASTPDMVSAAAQAFPINGAQAFANNSYMNPSDPAAMAFMNQQNYMMNPMAMMNPQQYMAMQMQMQGQMPMNMATGSGGMYNPSAMFNGYGGGMGSNQLPADPFNTPFNQQQQQAFPGQPQFNPVTGGFDTMGVMQSAAMMNPMSTFPMMPEQMMMNAFPFGMSMPQQQQQQQQLQNTSMQFQNPGASAAQAFAMPPQPQQQLQQQQPQQLQQQQPQQIQQQADPQTSAFPESSLFDDAINSNLFDGFEEDAFLLEM
ncbi:Sodium hydrogen exchanger 3 [Globisporangium polare]